MSSPVQMGWIRIQGGPQWECSKRHRERYCPPRHRANPDEGNRASLRGITHRRGRYGLFVGLRNRINIFGILFTESSNSTVRTDIRPRSNFNFRRRTCPVAAEPSFSTCVSYRQLLPDNLEVSNVVCFRRGSQTSVSVYRFSAIGNDGPASHFAIARIGQ